jgi:SPP1 gp7 family putative phage head morphogenesis protein
MPDNFGQFLVGEGVPPFEEAVAWFMDKGIVTPDEFEDLSKEMRLKAFTAAYTYGADELLTVYNACLRAIDQGTTLRQFVKETAHILERPWHRETVFRTNVLSAYGRGHWQQAQELKALRPYARYSAVMDGRTRPTHAALHGLIYPLDHPFWQRYWPPWDYNCRCGATTLSQVDVDEDNLTVRRDLGDDLPPVNPKFAGPASDQPWEPDYARYPAPVGQQLQTAVRAIYD